MPMEVKEQLVSWGSLPGGGCLTAHWDRARRRTTPRRLWPTPACYPWHTQHRSTLGNRSEQLELQQHTHTAVLSAVPTQAVLPLSPSACPPPLVPPRRRPACVMPAPLPPPLPKPTSCFWLAVYSHYVLLHTYSLYMYYI
jgi:hypothetical protein